MYVSPENWIPRYDVESVSNQGMILRQITSTLPHNDKFTDKGNSTKRKKTFEV